LSSFFNIHENFIPIEILEVIISSSESSTYFEWLFSGLAPNCLSKPFSAIKAFAFRKS
jgi:hypothetical protein